MHPSHPVTCVPAGWSPRNRTGLRALLRSSWHFCAHSVFRRAGGEPAAAPGMRLPPNTPPLRARSSSPCLGQAGSGGDAHSRSEARKPRRPVRRRAAGRANRPVLIQNLVGSRFSLLTRGPSILQPHPGSVQGSRIHREGRKTTVCEPRRSGWNLPGVRADLTRRQFGAMALQVPELAAAGCRGLPSAAETKGDRY